MRQIRLRRGRLVAPRLLITLTVAVAMLGLATNPAQADHEPVELVYSDPGGRSVTYDENGDGENDDDCDLFDPPSEDYTIVYPDPPPENPDGYPVVVWANGTDVAELLSSGP